MTIQERLRERATLMEIEAAALRGNGPLARDRDASTLTEIGRLAEVRVESLRA